MILSVQKYTNVGFAFAVGMVSSELQANGVSGDVQNSKSRECFR